MRIQPLHVLTATLGAAALLLAGLADQTPHLSANSVAKATDAAYRDGQYLAKLDIEAGRKPHLVSGRWSNPHDRVSFLSGYEQAYRDQSITTTTAADWSGYRDGLNDGIEHRKSDRPFRAAKTENYRKAGTFAGQAQTKNYRVAYANGYQQGYYSRDANMTTISEMTHF
jgi:hypothetical protein